MPIQTGSSVRNSQWTNNGRHGRKQSTQSPRFQLFGQFQRHCQRTARRWPGQNALFARQPARCLRLGLADQLQAVDTGKSQIFGGYSGSHLRMPGIIGRLYANNLDGRVFFQIAREVPMMVPVVPMLETKWVMVPAVSIQIPGRCCQSALVGCPGCQTDPESALRRLRIRRRASSIAPGIDADAG